jgi:hypothetical protein
MKQIFFMLMLVTLLSCKKEWLEVKPNNALVVPTKVQDFQALLDNSLLMNQNQSGNLGETSAGDLQVSYSSWLSFPARYRNAYTWAVSSDFYEGEDPEWSTAYQRILVANIALEGIAKLTRTVANASGADQVKGAALFFRAYNFYKLAQQYAKPYTNTSVSDPGIPLRLTSDINQKSVRASVKETYERIILDLNEAADLLPADVLYKTRPSKYAAYAMLARVQLSMGDYPNALKAVNLSVSGSRLMNYSGLDPAVAAPVSRFNNEVIFHSTLGNAAPFYEANLNVSEDLLALYEADDLRRKMFFRSGGTGFSFKGSYDGSSLLFCGLALDEMLLIRAECEARRGNLDRALSDLNGLLSSRWTKERPYPDFITTDRENAITKILLERKK